MILEYGIVDSAEKVGFYSGLIESSFAVLGLVTSERMRYIVFAVAYACSQVLPWTYASDRFGRKPIVMYGSLGMAVTTTMFGFSKTYGTMIIIRCVGGIFAGTRSSVNFFYPRC